ncbi:hypothetical protein [Jannaschia formosa]|uniref:hypothetical protein n=1 Tax=Jannaschia formosa TaxID=2259592 RepID=UPI0010752902|nr:hypothetical protein [Jannaschia formosa]TFL16399.1 hypothetical protein DR046_19955 [Jannaschia formosa]
MTDRTPYCPPDLDQWKECWEMTCRHCARWLNCDLTEAMIEHREGGPWPEGGWVTDPGAGVTCLSYQPRATQPQLSRQQLRRLARMNPASLPPVCGGCAATKGTDASKSLHTRRDFDASVKDRRQFMCHERPGYCGGWIRAVLARAGKRVPA